MTDQERDPRERGAWAPFVGVALAVLTAGSLVLFSLVAQRTSLDGFSTRGVTALAPSQEAPGSITLPGGATPGPAATSDPIAGGADLLTLVPPPALPALTEGAPDPVTTPTGGTSAPPTAVDVAAAPTGSVSSNDGRVARLADSGGSPQLFRDGRGDDGPDSKARGKRRAVKGAGPDKAKRTKNDKSKRNRKRNHGADGKGRGRSGHAKKGRRNDHGGGAPAPSNRPKRSNQAAASRPARSARPAPAPRPQPAAKPKPKSSGHSNTTGNGHSKDRGRGHGKG